MPKTKLPISLQSYAFQLRKKVLNGSSLDDLLDHHTKHHELLEKVSPMITLSSLTHADRFAWKFIREINFLSLDFSRSKNPGVKAFGSREDPASQNQDRPTIKQDNRGIGVYKNLNDIIDNVQLIWFPEMENPPKVSWFKQYSTRKLAHYVFQKDEIAFSLIFDLMEAPAEILSYLAYHELLHRQVGTRKINGRRFVHTTEFKNQEHLFPNWQTIDKQIAHYVMNTV